MKTFLLLFFSMLLLLFTLPENGRDGSAVSGMIPAQLKKACSLNYQVKRTCTKKCLKHQTHSEQQQGGTRVTDCGQQLYAVVATLPANQVFISPVTRATLLPVIRKYSSPDLEHEPEPPRRTS